MSVSELDWAPFQLAPLSEMHPSTSGVVLLVKGNLLAKAAAWSSTVRPLISTRLSRPSSPPANPELIKAFVRHEARIYDIMGSHEGIIPSHGLSTLNDGSVALIMDKADPGALDLYLRQPSEGESGGGRKTPLGDHVRWCVELAEALAFVHKKGVVMVDLNSRNVLLARNIRSGELGVKLCDFGAALADVEGGEPPVLGGNVPTHTPTATRDAGLADFRFVITTDIQRDIFALGSTLCEILLNRHPWSDMLPADVKQRHRQELFPSLLGIPDALERWSTLPTVSEPFELKGLNRQRTAEVLETRVLLCRRDHDRLEA